MENPGEFSPTRKNNWAQKLGPNRKLKGARNPSATPYPENGEPKG